MAENHVRTSFADSIIADNLSLVRTRISATCNRYGRDTNSVRLVAISKTKPVATVRAAFEAGQLDFGENQVQDALTKIPQFKKPELNWHFIGPLQSNKTKHLPENFDWWHTLNRIDLAQRVSSKALEINKPVNALIQVNVINDTAKSGVSGNNLSLLIEQLLENNLIGIRLRGLMTIGPYGGSETELRECFSELRRLLDTNRQQFDLAGFDQLSMGMTDDMEQAIAEGATMVRVGSAIFGSR
ncbi:MAG: YggS family pyridoxal phosphate-dependent enzyme [Acidiferrobacterales bacterium]